MSENKSLVSSIKDGLYEDLLGSIDQEFSAEVLTLPPTDPALLERWWTRVARAIDNEVITWQQFFAMFPPDYAEALKAAIIRKVQAGNSKRGFTLNHTERQN